MTAGNGDGNCAISIRRFYFPDQLDQFFLILNRAAFSPSDIEIFPVSL